MKCSNYSSILFFVKEFDNEQTATVKTEWTEENTEYEYTEMGNKKRKNAKSSSEWIEVLWK